MAYGVQKVGHPPLDSLVHDLWQAQRMIPFLVENPLYVTVLTDFIKRGSTAFIPIIKRVHDTEKVGSHWSKIFLTDNLCMNMSHNGLCHQTSDSFTWLINSFKRSDKNNCPVVVGNSYQKLHRGIGWRLFSGEKFI